MNTELFFLYPGTFEKRNIERRLLRQVCARCPIRTECLNVAVAYNEEGYWGGLTDQERSFIRNGNVDNREIRVLKDDLIEVGLEFEELLYIQDIPLKDTRWQHGN